MSAFETEYERREREEGERARVFHEACDAEGVPKRERASARKEHWSSVVQEAARYGFDVRDLVRRFGVLGPEGRKAAARLGGWSAAVDYVLAETKDLAA